jgi:hypothetical protein
MFARRVAGRVAPPRFRSARRRHPDGLRRPRAGAVGGTYHELRRVPARKLSCRAARTLSLPPGSAGPAELVRVSPHANPETADFIAVDLDMSRCGQHATVAFRYDEYSSCVFEVFGSA